MHYWIKLDPNSYHLVFGKPDVTSSARKPMVISIWRYLLTSKWFLVVPMIKIQTIVSSIALIFFARAKLLKKTILVFFTSLGSSKDDLN